MMERPQNDDPEAWKAYWQQQGQPWRTEPEITMERQHDLEQRRATPADIAAQRYPFAAVTPPLRRADVEYLLATLEQGRGPILWNDEAQREREGLDLRGVHVPSQTDLTGLPLARTRFGLTFNEYLFAPVEQREAAAAHLERARLSFAHLESAYLSNAHLEGANGVAANLEGADLSQVHLEGANLGYAHLEGANLSNAHLEEADLSSAHLDGASLREAHLEEATLRLANLEGADLRDAHLERAELRFAHLEGVDLRDAHLERADLRYAHLEGTNLNKADLEGANLSQTHLEGADLSQTHLEGANLSQAHLESANLSQTHLENASLSSAHLEATCLSDADYHRIQAAKREYGIVVPQDLPPADLRGAFFDTSTQLNDIVIGNKTTGIRVADVRWNGVNLAVIPWQDQHIQYLGDEIVAANTKHKDRRDQRRVWEEAVLAYRQVAVTLREQGINELADQFAYRAQLCQRRLLRLQRRPGMYVWSHVLDRLAGYGYRPARSFLAYLVIILSFAALYYVLGIASHPLSPPESVVVSMTAFHGRGFFSGQFSPGDPQAYAAALEAFMGLMIEVSFIATFTQRYFGK